MKFRCKMAGKRVVHVDHSDIEFACRYCDGVIEVEVEGNFKRLVAPKINNFATLPKLGLGARFTCPALKRVEDIQNSELVEVIEG